MLLQDASHAC